ncbi:MAG TPA: hypothetical protein VF476_17605 [Chitinophagaceae bacterium]
MRLFKRIDLFISILLIIIFSAIAIYNTGTIFLAYFVVGGWQVISMLTHTFCGWFTEKNSIRRTYHWISFAVIAMGCLVFVIPGFFLFLYVMLLAAPVMAIIYTGICYAEVKILSKRPLADFK